MEKSHFDVFPDSEYLAVRILKDDATGAFGAYTPRIGTSLPTTPNWSLGIINVTRIGGVPIQRRRLDHPNIQIDVWHQNKKDAQDIAQIARVILHRAEGKIYTVPHAVLTGVEDSLGMHYLFDHLNLVPRWLFGVNFIVHSSP